MKEKKIIAIDIGGTGIKYAELNGEGAVLSSSSLPTEAKKGVEVLLKKIDRIVEQYLGPDTLGIAISATGQIDFHQGKVVGGNPIIPGWIGCELVKILEEKYQLPCVLENDVNAAALGEAWLGAGKGEDNFLCLTLGTGIGGGIISRGELYRGASSVAGEFGKLPLYDKKRKYEDYASMTALVKFVSRACKRRMNGKEIFDLYWKGEEEIVSVVDSWIENIAKGLTTLLYLWNPSCIILGGGVTHQGERLREKIFQAVQRQASENYWAVLNLKFASLGNHAGLLGAAYLLLQKIDKKNK